jgi:hypothetical protein
MAEMEEDVLPSPTYDNLANIADELLSGVDLMKKRKISTLITAEGVILSNINYHL